MDGGGEAIPMDDLNGGASAKRRPADGEVTAPPGILSPLLQLATSIATLCLSVKSWAGNIYALFKCPNCYLDDSRFIFEALGSTCAPHRCLHCVSGST